MDPTEFKPSIIIPTYNRPSELRNCIQSLLNQTVKPFEIIIVDDGNLSELPFEQECMDSGIHYKYLKKNRPGLTESRNEGIKIATGDIIFFLDDDVVLFPDYIKEILIIYKSDNGLIGGVGGLIANAEPKRLSHRLRRIVDILFLVSGFDEGKILPSGFATNFGVKRIPSKKNMEVDFLSGGVMSFKKEIFREFSFDNERYVNYGLGEDQDFSYRVSRKYKLIVNPKAMLLHLESPQMRPDKKAIGRMFVLNRYLFFREHVKKHWWSWLFFYYALFGYLIERTIIFVFSPKREHFDRLRGVFRATKEIITGDIHSVEK
jgi:glucosyl-dolichyl phosphate glucuronosyltransferase